MAKRGLVVTYYFAPSGGGGIQRWTKLIKYLSRENWEFCVITAAIENSSITDQSLLTDIPSGTRIIRTGPEPDDKLSLKKVLQQIPRGYIQRWISAFINVSDSRKRWNRQVIPVIDDELENTKYDVIFISMPPYSMAELVAYYTAKIDIPVILDMRDPWTINPYKIYPTPLHRYLDRRSEKKAISNIRYIISAYQSVVDDYKNFSDIDFCVMPNGYDEEDFSKLEKVELPDPDAFNLAFSGSFYSHLNKPDNLFKAIKILKDDHIRIDFHHIGSSVINLKRLAEKNDISDCVRIWGYKNHNKCLEILNSMDAFCVILDPTSKNADKTIGGKLYEYLRLQKPIIGIVPDNGEAAGLIKETNSGTICQDGSPQTIATCIKKIINGNFKFSFENIKKYERDHQSKMLDRFVSDLITGNED